jgi:hypothetical protein
VTFDSIEGDLNNLLWFTDYGNQLLYTHEISHRKTGRYRRASSAGEMNHEWRFGTGGAGVPPVSVTAWLARPADGPRGQPSPQSRSIAGPAAPRGPYVWATMASHARYGLRGQPGPHTSQSAARLVRRGQCIETLYVPATAPSHYHRVYCGTTNFLAYDWEFSVVRQFFSRTTSEKSYDNFLSYDMREVVRQASLTARAGGH